MNNFQPISKISAYYMEFETALTLISNGSIVSIRNLIQNRTQFLEVKYDSQIKEVLLSFLMNLSPKETFGKEKYLIILIKLLINEGLLLLNEEDGLINEIEFIKKARSALKQQQQQSVPFTWEQWKKKELQQDSKETEQEQSEYILNEFNKIFKSLRLQIEKDLKRFLDDLLWLKIESSEDRITECIEEVFQDQAMNEEDYQILFEEEIQKIREPIEEMNLQKLLGFKYVSLEPFGSVVSGFAQKSSDIDISLNTFCYVNERDLLQLIFCYFKKYFHIIAPKDALESKNESEQENYEIIKNEKRQCQNLELIVSAQVPLITIVFLKTYKEKQQSISIDICVNNVLGCANSRALKNLSLIHHNIPKLGIAIKSWAKSQGLIGKKALSSYAFILVMFNFLFKSNLLNDSFAKIMEKQQDNLKYLIKISRNKLDPENEVFFTNIYLIKNPTKLASLLKQYKRENPDSETVLDVSLGSLFKRFILYYLDSDQEKRTISLFKSPYTNSPKSDYFFDIIDPFDIFHNPGDRSSDKYLFEQAFKDAANLIKNGSFSSLFLEKKLGEKQRKFKEAK